mgnify:CR=1 FL=1
MAPKHISMRGEVLDMDRLRTLNGDQPAVGNAQVNARGDKLGPNGVVLKTQEQIEQEWAAAKAKHAPQPVDIKSTNRVEDALARLAPKAKPALASDDAGFDPAVESAAAKAQPRRRVIDAS